MRGLKLCLITLLLVLLALPAAVFAAAPEAGGLDLVVTPPVVKIGATYDGTSLNVTGAVPAGSDVVVRFLGARAELHMKEKGKALGLLWMNLGSLTMHEVPSVVLVTASRELDALGEAATPYRLSHVAEEIAIAPADKDTPVNRQELLTLRREEGLYRELPVSVTLSPADGATQNFSATLALPSRLTPGAYSVEVAALKDGHVVASGRNAVQAELVGIPASMADVAFNHSLVYGILATVVALLSGLAIGLVFQSKGAH
jgi:uncharacterized protein (TIGR02186 family)